MNTERLARPTALPGLAWLWPPLVLATALVGGLASAQAASLYESLQRPVWAPPAALFGPVWGLLYALMTVSAIWVSNSRDTDSGDARRAGLLLFGLA